MSLILGLHNPIGREVGKPPILEGTSSPMAELSGCNVSLKLRAEMYVRCPALTMRWEELVSINIQLTSADDRPKIKNLRVHESCEPAGLEEQLVSDDYHHQAGGRVTIVPPL